MVKLIVTAPVSEESGEKNYTYEFDQPVISIGRLKENDIALPLSTVSGFHAQILHESGQYYIVDRGSVNGTYLNQQRIPSGEKKLLHDGDTLRIQNFEIFFSTSAALMNIDQGATVQVARQMVMEVLGSWESQAQEKPKIIIMGGADNGKQQELSEGQTLSIGRSVNCEIVIEHPSISRKHAEITLNWNGAFVKDLNSSNGVFVNDERINGLYKLHDRDEIKLGQQTINDAVRLIFSNPAEALLSKIQDQMTEHSKAAEPGPATQNVTAEAAAAAAAVPPPPPDAGAIEGNLESELAQASLEPVPELAVKPAAAKSKMPLILGGAAVLLLILVGSLAYFFLGGGGPVLTSVTPAQATAGTLVSLSGENLDSAEINSITIFDRQVHVIKRYSQGVEFNVPGFDSLESAITPAMVLMRDKNDKVLAQIPLMIYVAPQIRSADPPMGKAGNEIRIQTNGGASYSTVLFGNTSAAARANGDKELIVTVPSISEPIPAGGMDVPLSVKLYDLTSKNSVVFKVLPADATVPSQTDGSFRLTFTATQPANSLGFNEHAVATNLGPLLLLAAKDQYGSSKERAEAVAANLNSAVGTFQADPAAKITLLPAGGQIAIQVTSTGGQPLTLLNAFPDDALAYGKLNQRTVSLEEVGSWWQMLVGAYYRVFVQAKSPADTGILSSGGSVLEQIVNFYPSADATGQKFFKSDLSNALSPDQKQKLLALSYKLPQKIASVEGKWKGTMSNNLYSNISEENLELILTLRQRDDGTVTGNAEVNWKIVMGATEGDFQNVAYRKLGVFGLSGSYNKERSVPLQFHFTEKDGRRLSFVGRIDGDILGGGFSGGNRDGSWSLTLQK